MTAERAENDGYRAYHAPRFRFVLDLAGRFLAEDRGRILDVGPSPLTDLLRHRFENGVDTAGLEATMPLDARGSHYPLDLNRIRNGAPSGLLRYRLIVLAEVLEHLHAAPKPVLRFLRDHLEPGGVLILQTPNAVALPKRLKLLAGKNPFEMPREDPNNPGHFREYTLRELRRLARDAGFGVEATFVRFYFDARFAHHDAAAGRRERIAGALKNVVYRALPPSLREGITLVLRKPEREGEAPGGGGFSGR